MGAVKILKHFETPKEAGVYFRLVCLTGEEKGKAYFIMGNRIVMGRGDSCDVKIHDLKSSREHAEIAKVGPNFVITDLGSQNGVVVNDLKIKQHVLSPKDKIIIGKTVYKFSKIEVKEQKKESTKPKKTESDDDEDEEEEKKNPRLNIILIVVAIAGVLLIFSEDTPEVEGPKSTPQIKTRVTEFDDAIVKAQQEISEKRKEDEKKMGIYFQRGLREFREGNYYRAKSEFLSARQWSPNDPLANFYLRKTEEKIGEEINIYMSKAKRQVESINYQGALISYCSVLRVVRDKNDPSYKTADEEMRKIETIIGMEEGSFECVKGRSDDKGSDQ